MPHRTARLEEHGPPDLVTGGAWLLVILALVLVILIVQALRERDATAGRQELIAALARAPAGPFDEFIESVFASPSLQRASVLEGASLADYDADKLRAAFATDAVLSLAEARLMGGVGEPLVALMETQEATHVVHLGDTPLRVLVVNMPDLSSGPDIATQLTLLHKLAVAAGRTT